MKKFFYGLLACCLGFGFQSACGAVLCIGADGQVSIEMTCGTLVFPQQHCAASFPLHSDILPDQDGNASCDQCAMDIPIPGISEGVRVTPSDPSLLLPPVYYLSALFSNDSGRDEGKDTSYYAVLAIPDHSISMLRTTVLLI
ncbi:MAG: hypothetical protein KJ964_00420 [Verrucomicrobia bacterium]|nr:hypothetical protein [Verrucomicrobiota bacterium]